MENLTLEEKSAFRRENMHIFLNFSKKCHILIYIINDATEYVNIFVVKGENDK